MIETQDWRETEPSFHDILFDWMDRAPWFAISAAFHLIVFMILTVIPWALLNREQESSIISRIETPPELLEDEPIEKEPEIEDVEPEIPDEVELVPVPHEDPTDDEVSDAWGDPSDALGNADDPFEFLQDNGVIGIGGGAGSSFGDGGDGIGGSRWRARGPHIQEIEDALEWLAAHQAPDGSWDCDGFEHECGQLGDGTCDGAGESTHDVGVTGLALLAFLGRGNTTQRGAHRETVVRGIQWLRENQDPDTGLFGDKIGHSFLYNHSLATLAMCEAYYFSNNPLLRTSAQSAINYVTRARNPYAAWRYDSPPIGDNDTSVTGWMVFALKSAETAGLKTDPDAFRGALSWFDEVTDPATGRTGYDTIGSPSSRVDGINDHFPTETGEAMTAVSLLCRIFLGQEPDRDPLLVKQADLLRRSLPEWDPDGFGCDMYYWYYGTYAMYQMGGQHWRAWQKSLKRAVVDTQRKDGDLKGSWDPVGPWGYSGGRVYSTAIMTLSLEVYFRYSQVIGAR